MKTKYIGAIVAFAIALPLLASAATIHTGQEVSVRKGDDIKDNLYAAAGDISISGVVSGDVMAAGGSVLIGENVSEDITAAGGSITILGSAGGDVRAAGGELLIAGDVGGDLVAFGGVVQVLADVTVGKDAVIGGGKVSVNGTVNGNARLAGGSIDVNARIDGNALMESDQKITIGKDTVIGGNLVYRGADESVLILEEGAVINGETVFEKSALPRASNGKALAAIFGTLVLVKLLAFLLAALVLVLAFKNMSLAVVANVVAHPWKELLRGFVVLIVVPVFTVLAFVSILGGIFGVLAALLYGAAVMLAAVYAGIIFGAWMQKLFEKEAPLKVSWKNALAGTLVLSLIVFVPFIGGLIGFALFLAALGSIFHMAYQKLWPNR